MHTCAQCNIRTMLRSRRTSTTLQFSIPRGESYCRLARPNMHRHVWEKALSVTASILVNISQLNCECRAIRPNIPVFDCNYALRSLAADSVGMLCFQVGQCTEVILCAPVDPYALSGVRCLPGHHVQ
jgi:hypothetical protein